MKLQVRYSKNTGGQIKKVEKEHCGGKLKN